MLFRILMSPVSTILLISYRQGDVRARPIFAIRFRRFTVYIRGVSLT